MFPLPLIQAVRRVLQSTVVLLAVTAGWAPVRAAASEAPALEYKVKASYLFNFAKVVEWPAAALPAADSPFVIGVIGGGDAFIVLQDLLVGRMVGDHPVQVEAVKPERIGPGLHILFVTRAAGISVEKVRASLGSATTLVVGEAEGFAQRGGSINFVNVEGSVRFEANPAAAARARLKIGSQLLKLARVVEDTGGMGKD